MKKVIFVLVVVALLAAVSKMLEAKKAEWLGLTETELRSKLDAKIGDRMPAEKKARLQDNVVAKMRARGELREESA